MTKKQIHTVIVDDEPIACSILERYIEKQDACVHLQSFTRAQQAYEYLQQHPVDLLLLDIHMPVMNGLELLNRLETKPLCIFTTAYREYALDGFELDVVDYLMKPIRYERFEKAIEKVLERNKSSEQAILQPVEDVLSFSMHRKNFRLPYTEIIYLESLRNTVHIFTRNESYQCTSTLNKMLDQLPTNFIRIHRSFIVNKHFIHSFTKQEVLLNDLKKRLQVGYQYRENLKYFF